IQQTTIFCLFINDDDDEHQQTSCVAGFSCIRSLTLQ
ncbi:hypothetical protein DERF_004391, partial [Dermatophagoides farinae]